MGLHGGKDFGSVGHDAEHVGDVAALGEYLVEKSCQLRGDFAAVKPGNPRHRASFGCFYRTASRIQGSPEEENWRRVWKWAEFEP